MKGVGAFYDETQFSLLRVGCIRREALGNGRDSWKGQGVTYLGLAAFTKGNTTQLQRICFTGGLKCERQSGQYSPPSSIFQRSPSCRASTSRKEGVPGGFGGFAI